MRTLRLFLALAVLIVLLLAAVSAYGLPLLQIPQFPHPVENLEDCLACHDTGQALSFPEDHKDRTNDTCVACHQPGDSASAPSIPHPLEDREDCLVCHDVGQLMPFPENHQGLDNNNCQTCHQEGESAAPTPTAEPTATLPPSIQAVPTPIHEPVLFEENTCISCHEGLGGEHIQITDDWAESIHAARGVGCVSCHGGDPTQADAEAAMSPDAGYLGPLPKESIPGLCGSCHTQVDLMRPFDLSTDQLDQYWQSQHGKALAEGDPNVATCFDCHDGHRVLKVSDPASEVYPSNEPAMCAKCHSDDDLMAPYDIPTHQFDLYQESVHGVALLDEQNLRAPTCSTCHGKHGAAPPGYQEVANVCGQCHAATQDYYLEGAHRSGMTSEAAPRCVTCHGRYDVPHATRELFVGTEERHCGSCHPPESAIGEQVEAMHQALVEADEAFEQAEATIALATEKRLIMAEQEELLHRANTPLIESRALQHTVNKEEVEAKAQESLALSQEAQDSAEAALKDLDTRRLAMIIALAVIVVTIVALILIKLQVDRDLEEERAQRHSGAADTNPG